MQIAQHTWKYIPMTDDSALEPAWLLQNKTEEDECTIVCPSFYITPFYCYLPAIMMGTDQRCSGWLYKIV